MRRQLRMIEVRRQLRPRGDIAELGDDRGAAGREPARDPATSSKRAGHQVERLGRVVERRRRGRRPPSRLPQLVAIDRAAIRSEADVRARELTRRQIARPSRSTGSRSKPPSGSVACEHVAHRPTSRPSPSRACCAVGERRGELDDRVLDRAARVGEPRRSHRARRSRGRRRSRARARGPRAIACARAACRRALAVGAAVRARGAARAAGARASSPGDRTARRRR